MDLGVVRSGLPGPLGELAGEAQVARPRRLMLAMRWILTAARSAKGKPMADRLAADLVTVVGNLIDNALDAGAASVEITLEDGGLRSIRVNKRGQIAGPRVTRYELQLAPGTPVELPGMPGWMIVV